MHKSREQRHLYKSDQQCNYPVPAEIGSCVKIEAAVLGVPNMPTVSQCGRNATLQQQQDYHVSDPRILQIKPRHAAELAGVGGWVGGGGGGGRGPGEGEFQSMRGKRRCCIHLKNTVHGRK